MSSQFEFIKVNKSIFDYSEYIKRVVLMKSFLKFRLSEEVLLNDFRVETNDSLNYSDLSLVFYNEVLDLEMSIFLKKRNKETFV